MKQTITFLLIIFCVTEATSQIKEKGLGFQLGYAYQNMNRIDIGANYLLVNSKYYASTKTKRDNDSLPSYNSTISKKSISCSGINVSFHGFFDSSNFIFGQSIGYNYGKTWNKGLGFNIGAGFFHYSDSDFRITPSIGISFAEIIYLNYSYAIPLNNQTQSSITANQISIAIRYNPAIVRVILNNVK